MARVEKEPGFFHFAAKHVRACEDRRVHRDVLGYMRQDRERNLRTRTRVTDVQSYMLRQAELEAAQRDVLHHLYRDGGSGLSSEDLWIANDRANRRKDGKTYKKHAGHLPRLAAFITASYPYGVALPSAIVALERFADHLGATYGVACEAVIHAKAGRPDHGHIMMTDRVFDANGVGGKVRALNGIHSKIKGLGVRDGEVVLAGAMEDMRATWAEMMRDITVTDAVIDHRSFQRRGVALEPVRYVPRSTIRAQEAIGDDMWRRRRARELARRQPAVGVAPPQPIGDRVITMPMPLLGTSEPALRRKGRGRQNLDAAIAMLAHAARVRAENHRDHGSIGEGQPPVMPPEVEAIGEITMPTSSRRADEPARPRKRRGPQDRDAAIAMLAHAARARAESHREHGSAGQQPTDRRDAGSPGIKRTVPSRAATSDPSRPSVPAAERDSASSIFARSNLVVAAAIGLLAGGPVEFLKVLLAARLPRTVPKPSPPKQKASADITAEDTAGKRRLGRVKTERDRVLALVLSALQVKRERMRAAREMHDRVTSDEGRLLPQGIGAAVAVFEPTKESQRNDGGEFGTAAAPLEHSPASTSSRQPNGQAVRATEAQGSGAAPGERPGRSLHSERQVAVDVGTHRSGSNYPGLLRDPPLFRSLEEGYPEQTIKPRNARASVHQVEDPFRAPQGDRHNGGRDQDARLVVAADRIRQADASSRGIADHGRETERAMPGGIAAQLATDQQGMKADVASSGRQDLIRQGLGGEPARHPVPTADTQVRPAEGPVQRAETRSDHGPVKDTDGRSPDQVRSDPGLQHLASPADAVPGLPSTGRTGQSIERTPPTVRVHEEGPADGLMDGRVRKAPSARSGPMSDASLSSSKTPVAPAPSGAPAIDLTPISTGLTVGQRVPSTAHTLPTTISDTTIPPIAADARRAFHGRTGGLGQKEAPAATRDPEPPAAKGATRGLPPTSAIIPPRVDPEFDTSGTPSTQRAPAAVARPANFLSKQVVPSTSAQAPRQDSRGIMPTPASPSTPPRPVPAFRELSEGPLSGSMRRVPASTSPEAAIVQHEPQPQASKDATRVPPPTSTIVPPRVDPEHTTAAAASTRRAPDAKAGLADPATVPVVPPTSARVPGHDGRGMMVAPPSPPTPSHRPTPDFGDVSKGPLSGSIASKVPSATPAVSDIPHPSYHDELRRIPAETGRDATISRQANDPFEKDDRVGPFDRSGALSPPSEHGGDVGKLALVYAAALRKDRLLSRSVVAALRPCCPAMPIEAFDAALIRTYDAKFGSGGNVVTSGAAPTSRAVKDEVRHHAALQQESAFLTLLDEVDAMVREARRLAQSAKGNGTTPKSPGGRGRRED